MKRRLLAGIAAIAIGLGGASAVAPAPATASPGWGVLCDLNSNAWLFAAVFELPFQRHRSWTSITAAVRFHSAAAIRLAIWRKASPNNRILTSLILMLSVQARTRGACRPPRALHTPRERAHPCSEEYVVSRSPPPRSCF